MNEQSARNEENGPIHGRRGFREHIDPTKFPSDSIDPDEAYELLHTGLMLDGRETLNLASFVTTWMEPQAEKLIHDTLRKNHIDHEEYPAASLIEEACVHMLGDLFNAPDNAEVVGVGHDRLVRGDHARPAGPQAQLAQPAAGGRAADRPAQRGVRRRDPRGVGQVRQLLRRRDAQDPDEARTGSCSAPDDVEAHVDENTIAVGAVLGTTHIGEADPIEEINDLLVRIKDEKGWDIPLHVDGASGAFIAPVRRARPALGLPPRAGRVDQRVRATSTASSTRASAG